MKAAVLVGREQVELQERPEPEPRPGWAVVQVEAASLCVAAGLSGLEANLLTELWVRYEPQAYTATRGWSPEAMASASARLRDRGLLDGDRLSEAGRALRSQVEQATDAAMAPLVDAVGDRLDGVVARCDAWGAALVERGWFPPDAWKRAAG